MKRKAISGVTALLAVALMTGCGNAIPELNDQQQELVVEYAAEMALKYDVNRESKLVELTLEQDAAPSAPTEEGAEKETADEKENTDAPDTEAGQQEEALPDVTVIDHTQSASIEEFLNLDSVKFTYTGCEAYDFYPDQNQEEEFYFVMNATQGNKLLVLKFMAENISGEEAVLDLNQSQTRYTLNVNGERKNALTTMLLNDLAYYQGTIAPGESVELVLVCEVPSEQAEITPTLELTMKNVENNATISLN
ncbi:MAG: hypothetical protein K2H52_05315 [Lachnospiraceae bacterium]|nr:hypothetical protein [Lachnospiraceae bacterium]MDE6185245.1 hypothetical protein [Lachnospiraceae bacterium]